MTSLRAIRLLVADFVTLVPVKTAACVLLLVLLSLAEGAGLLLMMPLLELVGVDEETTMPSVAGWIDTLFGFVGVQRSLGNVLVLFVGVAGVRSLLQRLTARMTTELREDYTASVRRRLYDAIIGARWDFLVTRRTSEFTHLLAGEAARLGGGAAQLIDLTVLLFLSLIYLGLAFRFSPTMSLLVLGCAAILAWLSRERLSGARNIAAQATRANGRLKHVVAEHMNGLKTAMSYGAVGRHADAYRSLLAELRGYSLEANAEEVRLQQDLDLGSTVLLAVIVYVSYGMLGVPAGQLLVLLLVFSRLMPKLVGIYRQVQRLSKLVPTYERVLAFERECAGASESVVQKEGVPGAGDLLFDSVTFAYRGRAGEPVLRGVSLEIVAGRTTAIVGVSGSGKSTIADLMLGLLTPASGRILVGGVPLTPATADAWRRYVGYVPQDAFLLNDTIRANLLWASPDASEEDLWRALGLAAADTFVETLPHGLDTVIGERGVLVSGGERQRLALARALVRRPSVLVLDEATSALDSENEQRIQQAIAGLHGQMTIVIITHRLSTIRGVDMIYVVDSGRVVESGTWAELLHTGSGGRFRSLCDAQGVLVSRQAAVVP